MSLLNNDSYGENVMRGRLPGITGGTKFGSAPEGVQTTRTHIWDRADATPTQQLWVPPTAARVHAIVSSSVADDSAGTGARTVRVYGLQSWDSPETYEEVIMDGVTPVNTLDSYVIVHRMRVWTAGSGQTNAGTISATAATDGTVTAAIQPNNGSTAMAIYGVPSGYQVAIHKWWCAIAKASGGAASILYDIEDWDMAAPTLPVRNVRDESSVQSTGASSVTKEYFIPLRFTGPCIIAVSGVASSPDAGGLSTFTYTLQETE